jgi:hypothetical protein
MLGLWGTDKRLFVVESVHAAGESLLLCFPGVPASADGSSHLHSSGYHLLRLSHGMMLKKKHCSKCKGLVIC